MILADTSVWVDHFRKGDPELVLMLEKGLISIHPFIIGELACGNLSNRTAIIRHLKSLPKVPECSNDEVLHYLDRNKLMGRGIGWIDAHLLASSRLDAGLRLWTRDRRLNQVAAELALN